MSMNNQPNRCTDCGAMLPPNSPGNHCPKCLFQLGMTSVSTEPTAVLPVRKRMSSVFKAGDQFGHYHLVRLLGQGGMGSVYEAEDLDDGRRVALKMLSHSMDSPEARQRFFREGRLAASVNHPNSVYVFGTEEIAGIPVITMELVLGGTLQQRVAKQGPLPVGVAVDGILQIIEGLEAAQRVGVLHRDIKPSNCFIDSDGVLKIGDFGLSLSTSLRTESNLTVDGEYLGTPAFSSPEQLRGDELSVRSDIYAVGVTLYYQLTSRMPFEAKHMVQLLARVMENKAESPAKYRQDIPKPLCQAVLRCLEKDPAARFKDYHELRKALLPYASTAPTPATLGLRFVAGMADSLVLSGFNIIVSGLMVWGWAWRILDLPLFQLTVTSMATVLYYAVSEGLRGASLGKWICGLRVTGPGRDLPGVVRALFRASLYVLLQRLPVWVMVGFDFEKMADPENIVLTMGAGLAGYVGWVLLFCTMRRNNGFAGVHDLLTKTRVVCAPKQQKRPLRVTAESREPELKTQTMVGSYHVIESLAGNEWLVGYDARLLRRVWLHMVFPGTPPVEDRQRAQARVGRLRWLTGRRSEADNWDAYEAVTGKPLMSMLDKPQPWSQVRCWLWDLATEIAAAESDGTLPDVLALDRVWITGEGRAKLLDCPVPGAQACPAALPSREFFNQVAHAALGSGQDLRVPLPLHARKFLETLPSLPTADSVASALSPLLQKRADITRMWRAVLVAGCLAFPLMSMSSYFAGMAMSDRLLGKQPEIRELSMLLTTRGIMRLSSYPEGDKADDRVFATYIAGRYRSVVTNPAVWQSNGSLIYVNGEGRRFVDRSIADYPNPTSNEVAEAAAALEKVIPGLTSKSGQNNAVDFELKSSPEEMLPLLLLLVCVPAVTAALLFRGGLVMLGCGIAVVRRDGHPASRWRVFWRSLVAWSPLWLGYILLHGHALLLMSIVIALGAWSLALRARSLQDYLAGTCLVPR